MKAYNLLMVLLAFAALDSFAQDPAFTQYNSAPLYLNPGFAGSIGTGRAAAAYRLQWPGIAGGGYNTSYVSYDHYVHPLRGGLGLSYINDRASEGALTTNSLDLVYAAHINLFNEKLVIRPGIDIGYTMKKLDWDALTFGGMIDPRRGFVYTTVEQTGTLKRSFLDLGSGLVFATKYVNGGIAVHHLTEPDQGFIGRSKLPMKYSAHIAGVIGNPDSARTWSCSPHVLFVKQQDFQQLLAGITVKYDKYLIGAAYRNGDSFIVQAAFQNELFRAGYSYDHTVSKLSNATMGSHELSVAFNVFHHREKKVTPLRTIAF